MNSHSTPPTPQSSSPATPPLPVLPAIPASPAPHARTEAQGLIVILSLLFILSLFWSWGLASFWLLALGYVLYFFRDPQRCIKINPTHVLAPADGTIVEISNQIETPAELEGMAQDAQSLDFLQHPCLKIAIFLSVFNVHVNRAPIAGKIVYSKEKTGKFLDARNTQASTKNASRLWVIEGMAGKVGVRQISGAIARRIVAWSRVGEELQQGEKFGMIRFGSRTELYLPIDTIVRVRMGDRVCAGETIVAEWPVYSSQ